MAMGRNTLGFTDSKPGAERSDLTKLLTLAMGFVMATLDATVVNVASASIQDHFNLGLSGTTWIVDGYILTFASLLLAGGTLANRYGSKKAYLVGLAMFVLASLMCGVAPTGGVLILARMLQGAGAALFMPSSLSLLSQTYPDAQQRARMFGIWSAIVSTASGLGPFIGGTLVNTLGWRSIFLINIPIGVTGVILTYRLIPKAPLTQTPLNLIRHGLGVISLAALSFCLIQGPAYGWASPRIVGSATVAVVLATAFVVAERRGSEPILPRSLYRNTHFSTANAIGFLLNFALFGGVFMLGLFLQHARGASPFWAGVQLLPMMLVFVAGNLLFARLVNRFGTRKPMLAAFAAAGLASLAMTCIAPSTPYWLLALILAIANLGVGVAVPAMTATLMHAAGPTHANIGGATLNANRQIGALVGVALTGAILHSAAGWYQGASFTFLMMAISYLCAGFLVWRFIRVGPED